MPTKDPSNWPMGIWMLALAMSFGGGIVNWYARLKQGYTRAFNIIELLGEMFTSGFVGMGMFMALDGFDFNPGICGAAAGVSGHMATRLLFAVERAFEAKLNKWANAEINITKDTP